MRSNILPKWATQITTALPENECRWASNGTHCPLSVRLRLGTFTHRSSVLVLNASASKVFATISGKRIKRTSPTTNINLCPDSQTATQGTTNTGPPYRLDSSHQTEIYLRTSEALLRLLGSRLSTEPPSLSSLAPPFPGSDRTEPGPIGLAFVPDRQNNRGLEAGFFRRLLH